MVLLDRRLSPIDRHPRAARKLSGRLRLRACCGLRSPARDCPGFAPTAAAKKSPRRSGARSACREDPASSRQGRGQIAASRGETERSLCPHLEGTLGNALPHPGTDRLATDRNPAGVQRVLSRIPIREVPTMTKRFPMFAVAVLLASSGVASAQAPTRDFPDAANPTAAPPAANSPRTGTPDRPPAATLPDAHAPDPVTTGEAPSSPKKTEPEMDSVGGGKTPAGGEKK